MAKITFEDKVALNPQPSVAEKNKCTDANINEIKTCVNDNCTYSTTETIVGTFLGKPLYRVIVEATPNKTTETSFDFDINIPNVDQVFILPQTKIADTSSSGYVYTFPFVHSNTNAVIGGYIAVASTKLTFNVRKGNAVSFYAIRLVLEYTKTTD